MGGVSNCYWGRNGNEMEKKPTRKEWHFSEGGVTFYEGNAHTFRGDTQQCSNEWAKNMDRNFQSI